MKKIISTIIFITLITSGVLWGISLEKNKENTKTNDDKKIDIKKEIDKNKQKEIIPNDKKRKELFNNLKNSGHEEIKIDTKKNSLTFSISFDELGKATENNGKIRDEFVQYCMELATDYNIETLKGLIRLNCTGKVTDYLLGIEIIDGEVTYIYSPEIPPEDIRKGI